MSDNTLRFSKRGNALAAASAAVMLPVTGYFAIAGGFPDREMIARCDTATRLSVAMNCATDGWLALLFFGGSFLFLLPLLLVGLRRLFTNSPAIYMSDKGVQVDWTFLRSDKLIPYSSIVSVDLTTEGEAMSNLTRGATQAVTPLGAGWVLRLSEKKVCATVQYSSEKQTQRKLKISAQFI